MPHLLLATMPLLATIAPDKLPVVLMLCVILIVEAYIDFTQLKVPNRITLPVILSGWGYALIEGLLAGKATMLWLPVTETDLFLVPAPLGGAVEAVWASVGLTFWWPTLVLLFLWSIGGMGGGDVKMHMGFGAWMGALYGWETGVFLVTWGFILGVLVGGGISGIIIWWTGSFRQNLANVREIGGELATAQSLEELQTKAAARKPRMQLVPYGVPLCIGYLLYVAYDLVWLTPR